MLNILKTKLSEEKIESIEQQVADAADAGDEEQITALIAPLRKRLRHQRECANSLLLMIARQLIPLDEAVDIATQTFDTYSSDLTIVARIGESLDGARDIDDLNLAAPEQPLFQAVVDKLQQFAQSGLSTEDEVRVLEGLSTAARMMARQHDDLARLAHERLVELEPDNSSRHYNYGLFLKTRGFFEEGMAANRRARALSEQPVASYEWNFGICATGVGEGEAALEVWKKMGQKIEMGRFGLPDGGYPQCKVRLAERPLAEREKELDDPGREETIWIQRLSPCHGIVRSVLYQDLGVNYGDVVLIDGAPITYHKYGEDEIPVFPHLATLQRSGYQYYDFAATQEESGQVEEASSGLPEDSIVYSHTENFQALCKNCWRDPSIDHEHAEELEKHVVAGRIAAPGDVPPEELLSSLDNAIRKLGACRVYSPTLCEAAGDPERASVESRRFEMISSK